MWTELIRTKLLAAGSLNLDVSTHTLKHSTNHRQKQRLVACLTGTLHCAKHDLRHGTAAVRTITNPAHRATTHNHVDGSSAAPKTQTGSPPATLHEEPQPYYYGGGSLGA